MCCNLQWWPFIQVFLMAIFSHHTRFPSCGCSSFYCQRWAWSSPVLLYPIWMRFTVACCPCLSCSYRNRHNSSRQPCNGRFLSYFELPSCSGGLMIDGLKGPIMIFGLLHPPDPNANTRRIILVYDIKLPSLWFICRIWIMKNLLSSLTMFDWVNVAL